jgi:leucyl-tRNA---protein transferase
VDVVPAGYDARTYALYARYVSGRHRDGDMYPPSVEQFRSFLLSQWCDTLFVRSWLGDELVAVAVTDRQPDALSAVYTFFDPAEDARGLGVFSILQQIELCRRLGLAHLYLGYWIRDCQKMRYKTDYRPIELFANGAWVRVN